MLKPFMVQLFLTRMFPEAKLAVVNALKERQPSGGNGWRWCK
jgi:hypothetical protein